MGYASFEDLEVRYEKRISFMLHGLITPLKLATSAGDMFSWIDTLCICKGVL
jgi:hypothetical protein